MPNVTWYLYGKRYRQIGLPYPAGYHQQGNWRSYFDNLYENEKIDLWDVSTTYTLRFRSLYGKRLHFYFLSVEGKYQVQVTSSDRLVLHVGGLLDLGRYSDLFLHEPTKENGQNSLILGSVSFGILNRAYIESGWSIVLDVGSSLHAFGRIVLLGGSRVNSSHDVQLRFEESLVTSIGSNLNLAHSKMIVLGDWNHRGDAVIIATSVTVEGSFHWEGGSITGSIYGFLDLEHFSRISGPQAKFLSGVYVFIYAPDNNGLRLGVVAEYFQYRLSTSLTNRISSLYYFPGHYSSSSSLPSEFNYPI